MSIVELSKIKIPTQVYVGFQGRRSEDEVPLGFMTPYDTTQAGLKRQATVDSWADCGDEKTFNSVVLDNVPMIGFKLGRAIRRQREWGGNSTYVRIEDPRGFELEITIENMVMMMSHNIIEDGEIMQECVWGREGTKNILLPINSEPYMDSLDTTRRLASKLSLKDVKAGDKIRLVTGEVGYYYGSLYPVFGTESHESTSVRFGWNACHNVDITFGHSIGSSKRYIFSTTDEDGVTTYSAHASLKVAEIVEAASIKMTPLQVEQFIAKESQKPNCRLVNHVNCAYRERFLGFSSTPTFETKYHKVQMTEEQIKTDIIYQRWNYHYAKRYVYLEAVNGLVLFLGNRELLEGNFVKPRDSVRTYANRVLVDNSANRDHYTRLAEPTVTVKGGWIGDESVVTETEVINRNYDRLELHVPDELVKQLFVVDVDVTLSTGTVLKYALGNAEY